LALPHSIVAGSFLLLFLPLRMTRKVVLPAVVLKAQSVAVLIDPDTGVSPSAPLENKTAQEDVEKALAKWGRFRTVLSSMSPELVIVVRKGNGKMVQPTIGGTSPNNRPVILLRLPS